MPTNNDYDNCPECGCLLAPSGEPLMTGIAPGINPALDLLEELLSMTETLVREQLREEWREWQRISAECADMRDGNDT